MVAIGVRNFDNKKRRRIEVLLCDRDGKLLTTHPFQEVVPLLDGAVSAIPTDPRHKLAADLLDSFQRSLKAWF